MERQKIFLEVVVHSNYPRKISIDLLYLSTIDVLQVNVTISSASIDYFP